MLRHAKQQDILQIKVLPENAYHDTARLTTTILRSCLGASMPMYRILAGRSVLLPAMMVDCALRYQGAVYHVGMNYAAAVAPEHRHQGLVKQIAVFSNQELMRLGASHA